MKYRQLGRSGLRVSQLCLGTMNFGPRTPEPESFAILNEAVEAGINFIDTANQYGGHLGVGVSESILGRWLAEDRSRRHRVVLATKVHEPMSDDINDRGLSARHIQMACDASLKRLGVDHIDLYQMHHIDRTVPMDEIWQAMEVAVQQGKILYAGSSNFAGWHMAKAQAEANKRNYTGLVSEQSIYNLFERTVELEVLPACIDFGIGVIPWSPLNGGLLGGILKKSEDGQRRLEGRSAEAVKTHRPQIEAYENFCAELGHEPGDVAHAWLLHQPSVTAPIIGPRTAGQLDAAERAVELKLDEAALKRLDEIFPGHKPAPEDYAW